jgi:hypothetical protein
MRRNVVELIGSEVIWLYICHIVQSIVVAKELYGIMILSGILRTRFYRLGASDVGGSASSDD